MTTAAADNLVMRQTRPDDARPALLPTFFLGTLAMVVAIVAIARIDSSWGDVGAVALLVVVAGLLLLMIARRLGDEDDDEGRAP